ncbi:MAG: N-acetylmuramoyl-L-alanine amidase [Flavobacterium sp.]
MNYKHPISYFISLFVLCFVTLNTSAQSNKFKVVLDAGHGGKDFGAVHNGHIEKNIALAVVLKAGKILEKNPNIEVVYTRKSDIFIELDERANIANREDASIFVSVHCNANQSPVGEGFETYVMGVARNASNLEVAKKENGVITLEKDYQQVYEGYNPNSPESAIGIMMQQEEFLEYSIALASKIQDNFDANKGRKNRGVRQAGFLVLRKIAMPRILIELGFISNPSEGKFLDSEEGQQDLAEDIANAIVSYKKEYFGAGASDTFIEKKSKSKTIEKVADTQVTKQIEKDSQKTTVLKEIKKDTTKKESEKTIIKNSSAIAKNETPKEVIKEEKKEIKTENSDVVFKVQISAGTKKLDLSPKNFNGLKNISVINENSINKYMYGETSDYAVAKENLSEAKEKGYTSAYIVAFRGGEKISVQEAIKKNK